MLRKALSLLTLFCFILTSAGVSPVAGQVLSLPGPQEMLGLTTSMHPCVLKGLKLDPLNPFRFNFVLENGDEGFKGDALKEESDRLIRYFLAVLTTPDKDLWVNLSPYENNRIIEENLGRTVLGRDMLAQDYILKQLSASVVHPDNPVGKRFWAEVYHRAQEKFGTSDIPVNMFHKVWIVPDKTIIHEGGASRDHADAGGREGVSVYIDSAKLKVMLETDYLAVSRNAAIAGERAGSGGMQDEVSTAVMREVVVPVLEKEVNEGSNFARLRKFYHSLLLAVWMKQKLQKAFNPLTSVYIDRRKTGGVEMENPQAQVKGLYERYVQAFQKGVYNMVREDRDEYSQEPIPRKYFSGGLNLDRAMESFVRQNGLVEKAIQASQVTVDLASAGEAEKILESTMTVDLAQAGMIRNWLLPLLGLAVVLAVSFQPTSSFAAQQGYFSGGPLPFLSQIFSGAGTPHYGKITPAPTHVKRQVEAVRAARDVGKSPGKKIERERIKKPIAASLSAPVAPAAVFSGKRIGGKRSLDLDVVVISSAVLASGVTAADQVVNVLKASGLMERNGSILPAFFNLPPDFHFLGFEEHQSQDAVSRASAAYRGNILGDQLRGFPTLAGTDLDPYSPNTVWVPAAGRPPDEFGLNHILSEQEVERILGADFSRFKPIYRNAVRGEVKRIVFERVRTFSLCHLTYESEPEVTPQTVFTSRFLGMTSSQFSDAFLEAWGHLDAFAAAGFTMEQTIEYVLAFGGTESDYGLRKSGGHGWLQFDSPEDYNGARRNAENLGIHLSSSAGSVYSATPGDHIKASLARMNADVRLAMAKVDVVKKTQGLWNEARSWFPGLDDQMLERFLAEGFVRLMWNGGSGHSLKFYLDSFRLASSMNFDLDKSYGYKQSTGSLEGIRQWGLTFQLWQTHEKYMLTRKGSRTAETWSGIEGKLKELLPAALGEVANLPGDVFVSTVSLLSKAKAEYLKAERAAERAFLNPLEKFLNDSQFTAQQKADFRFFSQFIDPMVLKEVGNRLPMVEQMFHDYPEREEAVRALGLNDTGFTLALVKWRMKNPNSGTFENGMRDVIARIVGLDVEAVKNGPQGVFDLKSKKASVPAFARAWKEMDALLSGDKGVNREELTRLRDAFYMMDVVARIQVPKAVQVSAPKHELKGGERRASRNGSRQASARADYAQNGGIDLANADMTLADGKSIDYKFTPEQLQMLDRNITGLVPVNIQVAPLGSVNEFLK